MSPSTDMLKYEIFINHEVKKADDRKVEVRKRGKSD